MRHLGFLGFNDENQVVLTTETTKQFNFDVSCCNQFDYGMSLPNITMSNTQCTYTSSGFTIVDPTIEADNFDRTADTTMDGGDLAGYGASNCE